MRTYRRIAFGEEDRRAKRHLFCPEECQTLPVEFTEFFKSMHAPPEAPTVHVYENVVLAGERRQAQLYHADGEPIALSRVPPQDPLIGSPSPKPDLNVDTWEAIEEPVLFQSVFFLHWGHFLLESCARAWAAISDPALCKLPSLYAWPRNLKFVGSPYVEFWGATDTRLLRRKSNLTRLAQCYVPTVSFAPKTFAHERHLAAPRRVAARLMTVVARDERPAYLSRSQVGPDGHTMRVICNELEFEQRLEARGVRVVHMQHLTLAEQIEVMNAHRIFIGPWGTAFHNTLFSLSGSDITTFVLIEEFCSSNYLLVDEIVGNAAHYLYVLRTVEETADGKQVQIDVDAALGYLRECGVV